MRVEIRSRKIREAFVRLGPAFVKIGQALSTRRDALPAELCEELGRLQDEMPPSLSGQEAMDVIERELGAPASSLFEGLNATSLPVAAASLGQVYRLRDKSTGASVAVKIQRNDVGDLVNLDAVALRYVAVGLGWAFGARTDLARVVDEIVGRISDELDYEREARDAEKFGKLYGHLARVPKVRWPLTSRRVLTLTWIDGTKLEPWAEETDSSEKAAIIDRGVACTVTQFFESGFFHADPHPGNLLVARDGELCYLDFGKMGVLEPEDRVALMTLLVHFVNRDADGLAKDFVDLGCIIGVDSHTPPPQNLVQALDSTLRRRRKAALVENNNRRLSFQGVFDEVRDALILSSSETQISFRLPARFAVIVRALGALEGAVLAVDPQFRVVAAAYPHVARALLRDTSPSGRQALLQLLVDTDSGRVRWNRLNALASITTTKTNGGDDNDNKSTNTSSSSSSTVAEAVEKLGAPFAAAFVNSAIDFLDSPAGFRTTASLVHDANDALDTLILENNERLIRLLQGIKEDDGDRMKRRRTSSSGEGGFRKLGSSSSLVVAEQALLVVLDRPDVWIPVIVKLFTSPQLVRAGYKVFDRTLSAKKSDVATTVMLAVALNGRHIGG